MALWEDVVVGAGSALATSGLFTFLGKSVVERWVARNLEKYKAELQMAALEHQTRFTKLHEQRAAVITELYQRMDRIRQLWEASARSVRFNSEPSPDDQQIMASRLSHALVDFYFQNKLFFERELCQAMEELFRANWEVLASIGAASTLDQFVASGDVAAATSRRTFLVSANDVILNKLPPVMATVESKMRSMLGITEAPAAGR